MRLPLVLSLCALFGCAKTIIVPKTSQQYAIASYDSCAQGPFTVGVYVPNTKDQHQLRLSFTEDATPAKIFYQVKVAGANFATGSLEQKIEPKPGGFVPKNQCLGRVMPGMPTDGGDGSVGTGDGGEVVVQPGYQAPQYQWVSFAKVPDGSPSVEVELKDVKANTYIEVLYWSEVPYPLSKSRMQVEVIALTKEKANAQEKAAKKTAREIEVALLRESERFTAAKEKDAYLASLQKTEPKQEELYKIQRGKLLYKFSKQWSDSLYDDKRYSQAARNALQAMLAPQVSAFLNERQSLIYAYQNWKDDQRDKRRQERKDRRKLAVERYTKIEALHLKRATNRDKKLEKEQASLLVESELKDIKLKRGKKVSRYQKHFERFSKFVDIRLLGRSGPEAYYKLQSKASAFLSARYELKNQYEDWKENKKQNKKDDRKKAKQDKESEKIIKLAQAWRERLSSLKEKDSQREKALSGESSEAQLEINAKRGKDIDLFRRDFEKRFYKIYYRDSSAKGKELWVKLQEEANEFFVSRQEQVSAYHQLKENREEKSKEDKDSARVIKLADIWKKRLSSLKESDKKLEASLQGKSPEEKKKINIKRGKEISIFRKRFEQSFYEIYYGEGSETAKKPWVELQSEANAFFMSRREQVGLYQDFQAKKLQNKNKGDSSDRKDKYKKRQEVGVKRTKQEAKHFAKIKAKDLKFEKKLSAGSSDKKVTHHWGRMLKNYRKHFYHKYDQICCSNNSTSPADGSLGKLQQDVTALMEKRYSIISQYEADKNKDSHYWKEVQSGAHRALRQWNRAVKRDKAQLSQLEKATGEKQRTLSEQRQKSIRAAIRKLLETYNKANYYGQEYLAKARAEALALQQSLNAVVIEGPTPPPLPVYENPGQQPMDGAVWHNGYWKLENNKWVWKKGYWELPPGAVPSVRQ